MRRDQKEIEKLVKEQETSGLSVPDFCAQRGLPVKNFYAWRQQAKEGQGARFARVETSKEVRLHLSTGISIGVRQEDLGQVLKELLRCAR